MFNHPRRKAPQKAPLTKFEKVLVTNDRPEPLQQPIRPTDPKFKIPPFLKAERIVITRMHHSNSKIVERHYGTIATPGLNKGFALDC